MEVGAVKQAFNNEVIHLKKPLNQARIQIIHKLTRKAKTLVDKKSPENLKDKLKRKAESAVKEVMLIKKIKPKDLAHFIVTHKGELQSYLNKPDVDLDKTCARLLLHKSLQGKYSLIRERFCNVPIKDLFMSRLERRKLKKEQKEMQKNKKKEKVARKRNKSAGDWKVEDVDNGIQGSSKGIDEITKVKENQSSDNENESQSDEQDGFSDDNDYLDDKQATNDKESNEESDDKETESKVIPDFRNRIRSFFRYESDDDDDVSQEAGSNEDSEKSNDGSVEDKPNNLTGLLVKTSKKNKISTKMNQKPEHKKTTKIDNRKKIPKQTKESNKNKKLSVIIHSKKLKETETPVAIKVVDPFFVTSTGENYMSLAEPRAPDEVKEIHKQGNRKIRRAAMFGHEPRLKQRNNFSNNNGKFNKQSRFNDSQDFSNNFDKNSRDTYGKFNQQNRYNKDFNQSFNNDNKNKSFNKFINNKDANKVDEKPEKLHPSWEAKKKLSSVLPFQGKKIVFNDG